MTVTLAVREELASLNPSSIIELYEVTTSTRIHGVSEVYRFHAGVNAKQVTGHVVWAGDTYYAWPVEAEGFEYIGNGALPRPKIRIANVDSTITAILLELAEFSYSADLAGARVVRIRTLARFLDAVNFGSDTNPYGPPDPTAELPREVYYIDRKSIETRDVVEFELAAAFDLVNVRAPKRQCISNICQWKYKSSECGYDPTSPAATPLRQHYISSGYGEGRNINSTGQFNGTYYIATHADVAAAGYTSGTAYQHYLAYGIWEGRAANSGGAFNTTYYLNTYTDLNTIVYFNENDVGVSSVASDVCGKRLSSCKIRFGPAAALPFGSFPGVSTYIG